MWATAEDLGSYLQKLVLKFNLTIIQTSFATVLL